MKPLRPMTVSEFMMWARHHAYPADTPEEAKRMTELMVRVGSFDKRAARLFQSSLKFEDELASYLRKRYGL